jgi:hypothetical protein
MLPAQTAPILRETKAAPAALDLSWLIGVTLALYVLGFIFLTPASLRRRLVYAVVALIGIAALIVLLVWLAGATVLGVPPEPTAAPLTPTAELLETIVPETEEPVIETESFTPPPRWVGTVITGGAGLLLIAGALFILWRRQARMSESRLPPLLQLAQEARLAIDALQGGENVREVILRCYFEMVHVLDETRGIRSKLENLTRETLQLEQPLTSVFGRAITSASPSPLPAEAQALFAVHLPHSVMDGEDTVGPWNPEAVVEYLESTLEGTNDC